MYIGEETAFVRAADSKLGIKFIYAVEVLLNP